MKLLTFLLLLITTTLSAQTLYIKSGLSFSKLTWENSMIEKTHFNDGITGVNVMLGVKYLNLKFLNLNTGFGFIQKGGSGEIPVTNIELTEWDTVTDKRILNYLTLNTVVDLKIHFLKIFEPYISCGPRIDYLVSYDETIHVIEQFDDSDHLNKFLYGFLVGGGINVNLKKIIAGVSFDYYLNLNKIVDYKNETSVVPNRTYVTNKIYDRTLTVDLVVGYKFLKICDGVMG